MSSPSCSTTRRQRKSEVRERSFLSFSASPAVRVPMRGLATCVCRHLYICVCVCPLPPYYLSIRSGPLSEGSYGKTCTYVRVYTYTSKKSRHPRTHARTLHMLQVRCSHLCTLSPPPLLSPLSFLFFSSPKKDSPTPFLTVSLPQLLGIARHRGSTSTPTPTNRHSHVR